MCQFNEANSVRDFICNLVQSLDVQFVPGAELPRRPGKVIHAPGAALATTRRADLSV